MNTLASADRKMVLASRANFKVLLEFFVENHRTAARAFGPQAFRDLAFFRLRGGEFWFLGKGSIAGAGRRRNSRLSLLSPNGFLCEGA